MPYSRLDEYVNRRLNIDYFNCRSGVEVLF
jgi:hypothetical protein